MNRDLMYCFDDEQNDVYAYSTKDYKTYDLSGISGDLWETDVKLTGDF